MGERDREKGKTEIAGETETQRKERERNERQMRKAGTQIGERCTEKHRYQKTNDRDQEKGEKRRCDNEARWQQGH